jgi:hypothetical protein
MRTFINTVMNLGSVLLGARNPKAHHTEGQLRVAKQSYANSDVRNVMGQANLRRHVHSQLVQQCS